MHRKRLKKENILAKERILFLAALSFLAIHIIISALDNPSNSDSAMTGMSVKDIERDKKGSNNANSMASGPNKADIGIYKTFSDDEDYSIKFDYAPSSIMLSGSIVGNGNVVAAISDGSNMIVLNSTTLETPENFNFVCVDTCVLEGAGNNLILHININNAKLYITRLTYTHNNNLSVNNNLNNNISSQDNNHKLDIGGNNNLINKSSLVDDESNNTNNSILGRLFSWMFK